MRDAAHVTIPNMGLGIEDARSLSQIIDQAIAFEDIEQNYQKQRVQQITRMSYNFGSVAQWESPTASGLRNLLLRLIPDSLNTRHMERLLLRD